MADGAPPSQYLRDALARLVALRLLLDAEKRGALVDPDSVDRELGRIEGDIGHVLHLVADQ